MKLFIVYVLAFIITILRLAFVLAEYLFISIAEGFDWCDEQCRLTLDFLDPTKEEGDRS